MNNPNEVTCPNFTLEDYTEACNAMIGENIDEAAAIVMLVNVWNTNNAAEKVIWARQRHELEETGREEESWARRIASTEQKQERWRKKWPETKRGRGTKTSIQ